MKKRHSLEPNKYPYISPSMVELKYKDDISDTARYPLVKAHGVFCCRIRLQLSLASLRVVLFVSVTCIEDKKCSPIFDYECWAWS